VGLAYSVSLSPASPNRSHDLEWRRWAWHTSAPNHFYLQFYQSRIIRCKRCLPLATMLYLITSLYVKVTLFTKSPQKSNKDYTFQFTEN